MTTPATTIESQLLAAFDDWQDAGNTAQRAYDLAIAAASATFSATIQALDAAYYQRTRQLGHTGPDIYLPHRLRRIAR